MKKPVFITLLALSCLLAVTGIVFISLGTLSLRETSQEIKDCKTIKAETINDSLQFSNPVDRIQASITIENEYISPYQYVYKRENTYFLSNIRITSYNVCYTKLLRAEERVNYEKFLKQYMNLSVKKQASYNFV